MNHEPLTSLRIQLDIHIRTVEKADLPRLEWNGQFTHFRRVFLKSFQEQASGDRHLLIAVLNDYPIGRLFVLNRRAKPEEPVSRGLGYLYSFHVMEAFRGQGVGTLLLKAAETYLANRQFGRAAISVARTNHPARRLYERQGYSVVGADEGRWEYPDHLGVLRKITEPSYLLEKVLR